MNNAMFSCNFSLLKRQYLYGKYCWGSPLSHCLKIKFSIHKVCIDFISGLRICLDLSYSWELNYQAPSVFQIYHIFYRNDEKTVNKF